MPRDGNGVYFPDWTPAVPNTPISSGNANAMVDDITAAQNEQRPLSAGGTAASSAVGASDNIGAGATTVSSAATTNIVSVASVNVTISGTTTITAFTTASAGVKRFLTFSGSLTLTHNGTSLILPGGANIQTAAGDTAIALSLGSGNWKIISYTVLALPPLSEASTTVKGVVEKATDAEVYAATANKYLAADHVETASGLVSLTDAATIAVDWDAFINAQVSLTADRTLGNPTNGQPGTYRTILLKGSDGTPRQLSFGNQYLGAVPAIGTVANDTWYLLTIRCITTTHFVVSAQVALQP